MYVEFSIYLFLLFLDVILFKDFKVLTTMNKLILALIVQGVSQALFDDVIHDFPNPFGFPN